MKKIIIFLLLIISWFILLSALIVFGGSLYFTFSEFSQLQTGKILIAIFTSKSLLIILGILGLYGLLRKKGWIWNICMFGKVTYGYFKHHFRKSIQIFRSNSLGVENIKFLLQPFSGKVYSDLSELGRKLLIETNNIVTNHIKKINTYFSGIQGLEKIHVSDYKIVGDKKIFTLYRGDINAGKIEKIENDDILNGINLSLNLYNLEKEIGNDLKIIISSKEVQKTFFLKDYIQKFEKNTLYFGLDHTENIVKYEIDFSSANHFGVYGTTGYGKTNFTSSLLYSLYKINKDYNFVVIDPKGDLVHFKNLYRVDYAHSNEEIIKLLNGVKSKMSMVDNIFMKKKVRNYNEYMKISSEKSDFIKPTFVFIEEFSVLLNSIEDTQKKDSIIGIVRHIALSGRNKAYNMIFSLQVPLKKIINDSEITRMLKPVSFGIENSMNHHIFGTQIEQNLEKLNIGEGVIKNGYQIQKFKAFYVDKESLDTLESNNHVPVENRKIEEYLSYAILTDNFSKNDAIELGNLSRQDFDNLSKALQEKGILKKTSNNSLKFK